MPLPLRKNTAMSPKTAMSMGSLALAKDILRRHHVTRSSSGGCLAVLSFLIHDGDLMPTLVASIKMCTGSYRAGILSMCAG